MNALFSLAPGTVRAVSLADPRDCARIDRFVAEHPLSEVFHRPQWSVAVERGCRQRGHYLIAQDGRGSLIGCLPLTEVRSPIFGSALVSVGFGTGGGIIANNDAAAAHLAQAAWALAEKLGCATVELRGGWLPEGWRVQEGVYAGFAKPLPQGDEAILKSIKRRHRSIRRAQAFDLEARCGRSDEDLRAFVRAYGESVRNLGSPLYPPPLF